MLNKKVCSSGRGGSQSFKLTEVVLVIEALLGFVAFASWMRPKTAADLLYLMVGASSCLLLFRLAFIRAFLLAARSVSSFWADLRPMILPPSSACFEPVSYRW